MFKTLESRSEDLADTVDEVNMKLQLWQGSDDFDQLAQTWKEQTLLEINLPKVEEQINK